MMSKIRVDRRASKLLHLTLFLSTYYIYIFSLQLRCWASSHAGLVNKRERVYNDQLSHSISCQNNASAHQLICTAASQKCLLLLLLQVLNPACQRRNGPYVQRAENRPFLFQSFPRRKCSKYVIRNPQSIHTMYKRCLVGYTYGTYGTYVH